MVTAGNVFEAETRLRLSSLAGLLTAVKRDHAEIVEYEAITFKDIGDRVSQFLRIRMASETNWATDGAPVEFLLFNTHLMFPHNPGSSLIRLREVDDALCVRD